MGLDGKGMGKSFDPFSRRLLICSTGIPDAVRGASMVLLYQYVLLFKSMGFSILHWIMPLDGIRIDEGIAEYQRTMGAEGNFDVAYYGTHRLLSGRKFRMRLLRPIRIIPPPTDVLERIREFKPDLTFCFDIAGVAMAKEAPGPKIAWLGDLQFETTWYHAWYSFREDARNFFRLPFVWAASGAWRQFYKDILHGIDSIVVASKSSEKSLSGLGLFSTYLPYPWLFNQEESTGQGSPCPSKPTFLFFGTLVGLGSRSAFHFLLGPLYKRLVCLWGLNGFQIFICGTHGLPMWADRALRDKSEITYLGFVENLGALMRQCHAVIAPIDVPVGNRSRIVTAMAAGTPVIAHTNVALGNPELIDGVTCLLADNADSFCKQMQRVYGDPAFGRSLRDNAFRRYNSTYHPNAAFARMKDLLLNILNYDSKRV